METFCVEAAWLTEVVNHEKPEQAGVERRVAAMATMILTKCMVPVKGSGYVLLVLKRLLKTKTIDWGAGRTSDILQRL